ncbi:MAG: Carbon monoxide oxidation accessory protein CoxD [Olavius algarvensis Gamma 3 endosymbiont]|nr:MAG: Carbon monoxide oxidation accessory protein CoxD [Olavius algarvensis Gamma 3 endosymbiont]
MQAALDHMRQRVADAGYIADSALLTSLWLMSELNRPLLLEGDAGVGKTEVGKILAEVFERSLIRLQCYEGLDVNTAVYEWNYQRQLLAIRRQEILHEEGLSEEQLFSETYLMKRPLLQSISAAQPSVLLIDEIDRADEEFEAYLLEVLSDFQISIPELGTIEANSIPLVILTSNGTRELSDALRRRCLYHYIDYPDYDKELRIVLARLPEVGANLAAQIVAFVQKLRQQDLRKVPGVAETLDWTGALLRLDMKSLGDNPDAVVATLGCLLKTREDLDAMPQEVVHRLVSKAS